MLNKIKEIFNVRQSKTHTHININVAGQPVYPRVNFHNIARDAYKNNVYAYRCVNLIANTLSGIPIRLYRKDSSDRDIQIEQHPALDLLKKPNPYQGQTEFIRNLICYLQISGNTYVERVTPSPNTPPRELFLIRPDLMRIIRGDRINPISGYEYTYQGVKEIFPYEDIYHGKLFNPLEDPIVGYGQSPLESALRAIMLVNCGMDWNTSLLQNSANLSLVMKVKGNLAQDQREAIRQQFKDKYTGAKGVGQMFIAEGDIDIEKISLSPEEMRIVELLKEGAKQICIAFGIDSSLISDSANKTYSNFKESRSALYEDVILPLADWFRDSFLNGWLLPQFPNTEQLYFNYSTDDIEALNEERTTVYTRNINAFKAGIITMNEAREAIGFSELTEDQMANINEEEEEE